MKEGISITSLQKLVEKKTNKKLFVKMMWNESEKIILFFQPKMKINSFIYDEKEGYLFFDEKGNMLNEPLPCIIPEKYLIAGQISLEALQNGDIIIQGNPLSKEDLLFFEKQ